MDGLLYPTYITWSLELRGLKNFRQVLGKDRDRKLRRTLERMEAAHYRFSVDPLESTYLEKFIPLYEEGMHQRRGTIFDVRSDIDQTIRIGGSFETISLFKKNAFLGGLIFSVTPQAISAAFQIFPQTFSEKFPLNASYVADYYLFQRAIALGKSKIFRGFDRNLYGYPTHSAIGVADYKFRLGYAPVASSSGDNNFQELEQISPSKTDVLVLLASQRDEPISKALLLTPQEELEAQRVYAGIFQQRKVRVKIVHPDSTQNPYRQSEIAGAPFPR